MNSSRILGGLLCVASALVAILHLYFGYMTGNTLIPPQGLAFALPVTVFLLVATGLGFWLGWIMATTKEAEPASVQEDEIEGTEEVED